MRTTARRGSKRATAALMTAVLAMLGCLIAGPGTAAAITNPGAPGGPGWELSPLPMPTNFKPGETRDSILAIATNTGAAPTSGAGTVTVQLPAQVTYVSAAIRNGFVPAGTCEAVAATVTCTATATLKPGNSTSSRSSSTSRRPPPGRWSVRRRSPAAGRKRASRPRFRFRSAAMPRPASRRGRSSRPSRPLRPARTRTPPPASS